jgi:hypothetical protein
VWHIPHVLAFKKAKRPVGGFVNHNNMSLLGVALALGCSAESPVSNSFSDGAIVGDAATTGDAAAPPTCTIPERPFGMTVGSVFPQLAAIDCVTEEPYALYDEAEFCGPQVTFVSLAAGW